MSSLCLPSVVEVCWALCAFAFLSAPLKALPLTDDSGGLLVPCGRSTFRKGRIVGGVRTQKGQIPWQLALWRNGAQVSVSIIELFFWIALLCSATHARPRKVCGATAWPSYLGLTVVSDISIINSIINYEFNYWISFFFILFKALKRRCGSTPIKIYTRVYAYNSRNGNANRDANICTYTGVYAKLQYEYKFFWKSSFYNSLI